MATQKHMGRNSLVARLTAQVGGNEELAKSILRKRGMMSASSDALTAKGQARNRMTAEERAIDRAASAANKPANAYTYNPKTNLARLRKGK